MPELEVCEVMMELGSLSLVILLKSNMGNYHGHSLTKLHCQLDHQMKLETTNLIFLVSTATPVSGNLVPPIVAEYKSGSLKR